MIVTDPYQEGKIYTVAIYHRDLVITTYHHRGAIERGMCFTTEEEALAAAKGCLHLLRRFVTAEMLAGLGTRSGYAAAIGEIRVITADSSNFQYWVNRNLLYRSMEVAESVNKALIAYLQRAL